MQPLIQIQRLYSYKCKLKTCSFYNNDSSVEIREWQKYPFFISRESLAADWATDCAVRPQQNVFSFLIAKFNGKRTNEMPVTCTPQSNIEIYFFSLLLFTNGTNYHTTVDRKTICFWKNITWNFSKFVFFRLNELNRLICTNTRVSRVRR